MERINVDGRREILAFWLPVFLLITWISTTLSQPGYLSIDCGSEMNYTETSTGIDWVTDGGFISTGKNRVFNSSWLYNDEYPNLNQMGSFRYFAESRTRDCYVLPVTAGSTYLLRLIFSAGDLTSLTNSVYFAVHLNATLWFNFIYDTDNYQEYYGAFESIFLSPGSELNLCLVRAQTSLSYLSSIELREMLNTMYPIVRNNILLNAARRLNWGTDGHGSPYYIRYPGDSYDRVWYNAGNQTSDNSTHIRGTNLLTTMVDAPDNPPVSVMEDASVHYGSNFFTYEANLPSNVNDIHVAAYFQEVDGNASASNVRGMEFSLNQVYITSFNVSKKPLEITNYGHSTKISQGVFTVSFEQATWSKLNPILNAIEIYGIQEINVSATAMDNVAALILLQRAFNLTDWTGDPCLPVSFDWLACNNDTIPSVIILSLTSKQLNGSIPSEINNLRALTTLWLDYNNLTGSIPNLSNLSSLQSLRLQNNRLSGSIPVFLASLPNLQELILDNNNLSGTVPPALGRKKGFVFSAKDNPGLVFGCDFFSPSHCSGSNFSIGKIVGGTLGGLTAVAILLGLVWYFFTRKRRLTSNIIKAIGHAENSSSHGESSITKHALAGSMTLLSLQDVSDATKKFSKKIGEGSFGPVYYGKLSNGQEVAVKVKSTESRQGFQEFLNEVALLSRIHHRNLVSLVGYCEEAGQQILVYVYVSNGTLRDHLYGDKEKRPLTWRTRLDIVLNSARGLEYLHTDCNPRIIHRDVKSSNILLDDNMVAKVADFGISKQEPEGIFSGVDTLLKGTPGYFDPEYFITQRLTQKSDVYSFGVVLLEVISGRHPHISEMPNGTTGTLIQCVQKSVREGRAMETVDPALRGRYNLESMLKVIALALSCVEMVTASRPDMRQVVSELTEAISLEVSSDPGVPTSLGEEHDDLI